MLSLILASNSPRRRQFLKAMGWTFRAIPSGVREQRKSGEGPEHFAVRMAREKALDVAGRIRKTGPCCVLGADTVVVLGGRVLGKPRDARDARRMLRLLRGRTHRVVTGVALIGGPGSGVHTLCAVTRVRMKKATDGEIERYIATGEPLDKAGAYAIQGKGAFLVESIHGSYTNVVGLPLAELQELMEKACGLHR